MTEQAIEKINTEMQEHSDDFYYEIIGHYIIDRCADPAVAAAVMDEGKTLFGAEESIRAAAGKKKKGSVGVLKDSEVFDAIDLYFGFSLSADARAESVRQVDGGNEPAPAAKKPAGAINLDFGDFF
jgi:hypothetical protein